MIAGHYGEMDIRSLYTPSSSPACSATGERGRAGPSALGLGNRHYGPMGHRPIRSGPEKFQGQISQDLTLPLQFPLHLIQAWRRSHNFLEKVMFELRPNPLGMEKEGIPDRWKGSMLAHRGQEREFIAFRELQVVQQALRYLGVE